MAVPFHVPDEPENGSPQPQSTTTSATQTPPQSPTNDHLVRVFYEALSLYSANLALQSPSCTSPPSSPSCGHTHSNNNRGNIFFSRPHYMPQSPLSYGGSQQSPMASPSCSHSHSNNHRENVFFVRPNVMPPTPSYGLSQQSPMATNEILRRRLNSTGEEEYEDIDSDIGIDESPSATSNSSSNISTPASPSLPANFNLEEHYTYLEARERLQQFPGQVPQKKKKVVSEKKPKSMDQSFVWTTVMTAAVLAVGYITSR